MNKNTSIIIRQEQRDDHEAVFSLISQAFATAAFSDHKEHFLVQRLRNSTAFIPELSLVAESDGKIVGHILLTKITIKNATDSFDALALAPVSVLPSFQGKGIGGQLITASHQKAKALGHQSIVLLGHADYYPKFGYQVADSFGIEFPFDVPKENCMAVELTTNSLQDTSGTVVYPAEFFQSIN